MADVAVITPSIPARRRLLAQAEESVRRQTVRVDAHLIDRRRRVPVATKRNNLLTATKAEWVAFLDDDDLLDPDHLETLLDRDADVVVPYCRFDGPPLPPGHYNRPFDAQTLREHAIFPITVIARREVVLDAGGFPNRHCEDYWLWRAMLDAGATFEVVPKVTWTYRTAGEHRRSNGGKPSTYARARYFATRRLPEILKQNRSAST